MKDEQYLPEQEVFMILNNDKDFISKMDEQRKKSFDDSGELKGIFLSSIPELYQKDDLAPFVKVSLVNEHSNNFADNRELTELQRVQVTTFTNKVDQYRHIKPMLKDILSQHGFFVYDIERYKDPDLEVYNNVLKVARNKFI